MEIKSEYIVGAIVALSGAIIILFGLVMGGYRDCKKREKVMNHRIKTLEELSCIVSGCKLRTPIGKVDFEHRPIKKHII